MVWEKIGITIVENGIRLDVEIEVRVLYFFWEIFDLVREIGVIS